MSTPQNASWNDDAAAFSSIPAAVPPPAPVASSSPFPSTAGAALVLGRAVKVATATGKTMPATGVLVGDGNETIGVCGLAAAADGSPTTIYTTGMRAPIPGLSGGLQYRSTTGALVLYAAIGSGDYTQPMGYYDATNEHLYVAIGVPEQKP